MAYDVGKTKSAIVSYLPLLSLFHVIRNFSVEPCIEREKSGNSLDTLLRAAAFAAGCRQEAQQQGPKLLQLAWHVLPAMLLQPTACAGQCQPKQASFGSSC